MTDRTSDNNTTSTVNISVESTEVVGAFNASKDGTIFCAERDDLHESHLQSLKNPKLLENKMDSHRSKETWHIPLRGSVSNIVAEVFTTQNITTALKCRLVTTLTAIICIIVLLFLAPIIWYNTNPPSAEAYVTQSTVFYNLEVDSCIVSFYTNVHKHNMSYIVVQYIYTGICDGCVAIMCDIFALLTYMHMCVDSSLLFVCTRLLVQSMILLG